MRYADMNLALLNKANIEPSSKTTRFYDYLLKNSVAYYFSEQVSTYPTAVETKIIERGDQVNEKYHKTLELLRQTFSAAKIDFALFKTHRHISEVYDGDIDIVVRKTDFDKAMSALAAEGFDCETEAEFKGVCIKQGYCKIEPRSVVSFHGYKVFDEKEIWDSVVEVNSGIGPVKSTSMEFDTVCLLLNVLYGPKYVSLYLYLLLMNCDPDKIKILIPSRDLGSLADQLKSEKTAEGKFPIFLSFSTYFQWYVNYLLPAGDMGVSKKIRHLLFFVYSKLKYQVFGKLHFQHNWL